MATINDVYKIAAENREALNTIKDLAKKTDDYLSAGTLQDTDKVRVSRNGTSFQSTVAEIKAASGGGDVNVQANWDEVDPLSDAYINNKPVALSQFTNDLILTTGSRYFATGIVAKYPGNVAESLEVNDMRCDLWWSSTLYIKQMRYNGGLDSLLTSYTIIDSIEY